MFVGSKDIDKFYDDLKGLGLAHTEEEHLLNLVADILPRRRKERFQSLIASSGIDSVTSTPPNGVVDDEEEVRRCDTLPCYHFACVLSFYPYRDKGSSLFQASRNMELGH